MYKVVADITLRELINEMESGQARIVEDVPLFDRAVDAIISGMKHMTGGAGQAQSTAN
jgi:exonuclease VII small subunit